MTYGLVESPVRGFDHDSEAVSHAAELVRGDFLAPVKAPSSALRAPSPQGEKGHVSGVKQRNT